MVRRHTKTDLFKNADIETITQSQPKEAESNTDLFNQF